MSRNFDTIDGDLAAFLAAQHMFFVATAPLAAEGHVNVSPKGLDSFRILDERTVAYLDLTGSGAETIAHLNENGRIVLMFCAFDGRPRIVRLHGRGEVLLLGSPEFDALINGGAFPSSPGARAIIRVCCGRISDSCGTGVPRYEYLGEQDGLCRFFAQKGPDGLADYRREKNARSIDGLPAISPS